MLNPALLETLSTTALIVLLFAAAALSILALPWSERDLRKVHTAAVTLMFPKWAQPVPAEVRAQRAIHRRVRHA